jgi:hypothetical protein
MIPRGAQARRTRTSPSSIWTTATLDPSSRRSEPSANAVSQLPTSS